MKNISLWLTIAGVVFTGGGTIAVMKYQVAEQKTEIKELKSELKEFKLYYLKDIKEQNDFRSNVITNLELLRRASGVEAY